MPSQHDPEAREVKYLHQLAGLAGKHVLEIGCGDGRLTWQYAASAGRVTATDPDPSRLDTARRNCPSPLRSRVALAAARIQSLPFPAHTFDLALMSWSF